MKRKLVAAIACRNKGTRLYGKPLQNLDEKKGIRIIDNIISCIREINVIDEIVLGIAEGPENEIFKLIAKEKKIDFIIGDEENVLSRLIKCGEKSKASDIFRITSESPFLYFQSVDSLWNEYKRENLDAIFQDDIIDGCGFEIISLKSLKKSHLKGLEKHRSELCTLYIRENQKNFRIKRVSSKSNLIRKDLRLTVDNPEDLIVCRKLYKKFYYQAPKFIIEDLIEYLDKEPDLKKLIYPFTINGYKNMYL